jgi:hypothetical protein
MRHWHSYVPFDWLHAAHRSFRRFFFTKPRPEGKYIVLSDMDVQDAERLLGRMSFAPNWEFSYNYKGEDINLARIEHETHPEYTPVWWQYHVRGWQMDDAMWLRVHWEAEPTEHHDAHFEAIGAELERGFAWLSTELRKQNMEFSIEEYDNAV